MAAPNPVPRDRVDPPALHDRAMDNLRFIRETMERASAFTAVPGWGGVAMGVVALVDAIAAGRVASRAWCVAWIAGAIGAGAIGLGAIVLKARRSGMPLAGGPARRFALAFAPPMAAGFVLTLVFVSAGAWQWLAGIWLLLYGTAVTSGGALSVRIVPLMGVAFMLLGVVALAWPAAGPLLMAVGFGGLQIGFGAVIGVRYGG